MDLNNYFYAKRDRLNSLYGFLKRQADIFLYITHAQKDAECNWWWWQYFKINGVHTWGNLPCIWSHKDAQLSHLGTENATHDIYMHVRDSPEVNTSMLCGKMQDPQNVNMLFTSMCYKNVSFHKLMELNKKKIHNFVSRRLWSTPLQLLSKKCPERQIS